MLLGRGSSRLCYGCVMFLMNRWLLRGKASSSTNLRTTRLERIFAWIHLSCFCHTTSLGVVWREQEQRAHSPGSVEGNNSLGEEIKLKVIFHCFPPNPKGCCLGRVFYALCAWWPPRWLEMFLMVHIPTRNEDEFMLVEQLSWSAAATSIQSTSFWLFVVRSFPKGWLPYTDWQESNFLLWLEIIW